MPRNTMRGPLCCIRRMLIESGEGLEEEDLHLLSRRRGVRGHIVVSRCYAALWGDDPVRAAPKVYGLELEDVVSDHFCLRALGCFP